MVRKSHLHQTKYPFDDYPFEAMCCGSWQAVKRIRIKNGTLTFHLVDDQFMVLERGPFSAIRIRSRKASSSDCTRILRPGVDVCVLTTSGSDLEDSEPVWIDAKISSIERKPHDYLCLCEFHVTFYTNKKPLGLGKGKLSKEVNVIGIDQISILQKFEKKHCEDRYYRWDFAENTSLVDKTKILVGKFLSDISWLIVTSALKRISFDVRSVENKIVYEILEGDLENRSSDSNRRLKTINFKVEDEKVVPLVVRLGSDGTVEDSLGSHTYQNELVPYYGSEELRRSKRRKVQPDRYLGCDNIDNFEIDYNKLRPYRTNQCDDDEMTMPLSCLFGVKSSGLEEEQNEQNRIIFSSSTRAVSKKLVVSKNNREAGDMKSSFSYKNKDEMELAIVPQLERNELIAIDSQLQYDEMENNYAGQIDEISPKYYYINTTRKVRRRNIIPNLEDMEFAKTWGETSSTSKLQRTSFYNTCSKGNSNVEERVYQRRSLGAGGYKDLINSFLKMADSTEKKEDPDIIDQWKEFKEKSRSDRRQEPELIPNEDEQELSENEMLWREMELSLASSYLSEDYEVSNAKFSADMEESSIECCHEYILNEELGILCHICGFVCTEIKNVTSPFMQNTSWNAEQKPMTENNTYCEDEDDEFDASHESDLSDPPVIEENENVWALIPELRRKLHLHQKKAFEFLWQNIAGSVDPSLMKSNSKKIGGCVVSHTPGAGKTFLIIAFLVSYLKLFPRKRPLVLAPKTTLYTWYKEFIKWEIPVPVHLIHGRRSYRVFRPKNVSFPGFGKPTDDVMHIIDCLEKIQKWHAHPSVLVMGYTSFLTLMRDDSAFPHRKFMARVLRESPGILILDEGHNPRSTKSRLRKGLMKIHTDLRILLSGTLFQNNFCEYFNTLCLARPKFVKEVLKELDPKYKTKNNKSVKKAWSLQESRARKFFLDTIAKKIDSDVGEERMKGLNMLRSLTNGFIDVYEGGNAECLPGLQIYTLLMNSTDMQKEILEKLHREMESVVGFPLEIELLITLGSIHPSLVTSAVCARKFFNEEELREIGNSRFDLRRGSKVRFVLKLVHHIAKREKVLVFCHNIAPVKYFVELFESVFRWKRGREVLTLTGDLELFERGKIMDTFEDPGSRSRVLLASITACAEGISLTAASRVILLDSEWNPSKTKQAIARAFRPGQQKVVYVYQLLMSGTLEEDKYRRTTWKEWVSSMIFSEAFVEDPSKWQAEKIEFEDDVLREMVEEDRSKCFHMILKNEKASTTIRGKD